MTHLQIFPSLNEDDLVLLPRCDFKFIKGDDPNGKMMHFPCWQLAEL